MPLDGIDPPDPRTEDKVDPWLIARLEAALAEFSTDQQSAWHLSQDGVPHTEIGKRVGRSERTIRLWLFVIRARLMEVFDEE
jgi:DNA-directed RNA polymerase specialized sigma24 family protein